MLEYMHIPNAYVPNSHKFIQVHVLVYKYSGVCLSVCLSVFTRATLCTTTMVYGVLVHQEGAICTTKAQYAPWCTRETIFFCLSVCLSDRYIKWVLEGLWGKNTDEGTTREGRQRSGVFLYIGSLGSPLNCAMAPLSLYSKQCTTYTETCGTTIISQSTQLLKTIPLL